MGLDNPKDFSFRSIPLSFDQVLHVIHELNKENCNVSGGASRAPNSSLVSTQNESCHPPMVDIDANNVAFKYFLSRKTSPVHGIIQLADLFVNNDTDVCVVADGKLRHDTKRESTTRKVKIELANEEGEEITYIHNDKIPITLPFYLRAYKCPGLNDVIDNGGVEVLLCHSVFSQTHEFLKEEGWFTCKLCSNITCRHCCNQNDEFHKICIPCHTAQTTQASDNIKSQEEMIKELMDSGHNFQKLNMTNSTTLELYERYKEFNHGNKGNL